MSVFIQYQIGDQPNYNQTLNESKGIMAERVGLEPTHPFGRRISNPL